MKKTKTGKAWLVACCITICLILLGFGILSLFKNLANPAEDAIAPLDKAMMIGGATKLCTTESAGFIDNRSPWITVIYKIPGGIDAATKIVKTAASQAGFSLKDGPVPSNPENNKFFSDDTMTSKYKELKAGKVKLLTELYGSKVFSGDRTGCTVVEPSQAVDNATTADITISLPERK